MLNLPTFPKRVEIYFIQDENMSNTSTNVVLVWYIFTGGYIYNTFIVGTVLKSCEVIYGFLKFKTIQGGIKRVTQVP